MAIPLTARRVERKKSYRLKKINFSLFLVFFSPLPNKIRSSWFHFFDSPGMRSMLRYRVAWPDDHGACLQASVELRADRSPGPQPQIIWAPMWSLWQGHQGVHRRVCILESSEQSTDMYFCPQFCLVLTTILFCPHNKPVRLEVFSLFKRRGD